MIDFPIHSAITRLPALPRSAWLYHQDSSGVTILAGPGVEAFETGLFEGCWSGEFREAGFASAENVFGSGLTVGPDGVRFVTPTHALDELVAWIGRAEVTVSNSLPFLLEFRGVNLPYTDWGRRFYALAAGIDADYRELHRTGDGRLLRIVYDDFEVRDGGVRTFRPSPGPAFTGFEPYRDYLREQLGLAMANGRDPARRRPLRAVAAVSSGYDSTASAALAAGFGLDCVVTLDRDRNGGADSGLAVARDLGLEAVVRSYPRGSGEPDTEAAFIATGSGGEDLHFAAFAEDLSDAMVITGFYGGAIWNPHREPVGDFRNEDRSGASLSEFCLGSGATMIPVPSIGARHHHEIRRIALSAAMEPWRVGGDYDRPIPRRIVEEAGVRRESFGRKKRATSQLVFSSGTFLSSAGQAGFAGRERALVGARWAQYQVARLRYEVRWTIYRIARRVRHSRWGAVLPARLLQRLIIRDVHAFEHLHPRWSNALFLWGLERRRHVYREALEKGARTEHAAGGSLIRNEASGR